MMEDDALASAVPVPTGREQRTENREKSGQSKRLTKAP